jgi:hypothetical protein
MATRNDSVSCLAIHAAYEFHLGDMPENLTFSKNAETLCEKIGRQPAMNFMHAVDIVTEFVRRQPLDRFMTTDEIVNEIETLTRGEVNSALAALVNVGGIISKIEGIRTVYGRRF